MIERIEDRGIAKGPLAWLVQNRVTPNLLMIILLVGGFLFATTIKQEVFPEFQTDIVRITVPYPGSNPEEVEHGIILAIEEAVRGLDGIKEVNSTASEGMGAVSVELMEGIDRQKLYQDIKQEVDRIVTFPEDAERPEVSLLSIRRQVLQIVLYGDVSEWQLRQVAEEVRDRLLQNSDITQLELDGAKGYELKVLIDQDTLRSYGLTLQEVADRIRSNSVELSGGEVETSAGDILLRVKQRKEWAREFAVIPVVTSPDGTVVRLEDIASVRDGFRDVDRMGTYNGMRAIGVNVFRVGDQTPINVSTAAREEMRRIEAQLPAGIHWTATQDRSEIYSQRLTLLLKNGFLGLLLVLALLGLFLEFKLAFWVTLGIPISFLGAFLFLPGLGVTINMISMFAFIVSLGIVVDDAIVVGENIYEYRKEGADFIKAAILGTRDIAVPVTFSILTNVIAFSPLMFIPGVMGKIWRVIPLVVITVFIVSLVEALVILPAHLAHSRRKSRGRLSGFLHNCQQSFSRKFEQFIEDVFGPFLHLAMRFRKLTIAISIALLVFLIGFVFGGRIGMILMPRIESDFAVVTATLPYGSPFERVMAVRDLLEEKAEHVVSRNGDEKLAEGIFTLIDENTVEVTIQLTDPDVRTLSTKELTRKWREEVGPVSGLESIVYESDRGGPGGGAALSVELSHRDVDTLHRAGEKLAGLLADYSNVRDIDDGYTPGKEQLSFKITPEGESLGLTARSVAQQIRNAFFGAEAVRQQRGRNEVRVRVKFPENRRDSQYDVENLLITTPAGRHVPLMQIAELDRGRSYTSITRKDGRRTTTVSANVIPLSQTDRIEEAVTQELIPALLRDFPGLSYSWGGRQEDFLESMEMLISGFILAMLAIYAMLAIPFESYFQPVIVMAAIPFGIVGAVLGHIIMGYSLSIMSMMGIVALSGVVVNDSLILITYANKLRTGNGASAFEAIHRAGIRRFRPVMLTTLTTFGGLTPIILETSMQARFMIPMAISLGFGILFATTITLVIVPSLYLILEDLKRVCVKITGTVHKPSA